MCRIHGKTIDDATSTHTVELLNEWKLRAEERARVELGRPLPLAEDLEAVATRIANDVVDHLKELTNGAQSRRSATLDEFDRQLRLGLGQYRALLESGATTPEELLKEPEFQKIVDNYIVEATREALLSRAEMLAHALVGTLCDDTLTISQKSRVERVIRELDPENVLHLHRLNSVNVPQSENDDFPRTAMARDDLLSQFPESADVLEASGCVSREQVGGLNGGYTTARVTAIGERVLRILENYVRSLDGRSNLALVQ